MWSSSWTRWGIVLGFALGGFFDGILLHQILQWHHLLSLVAGVNDLRLQVLWDGYFHALMYFIAAVGLSGLWRAHRHAEEGGGGRHVSGALLVGFGIWHVVDGVLSHWLLGIHRIKLDSDDPLLWDLIWFTAFGLAPLAGGWLLVRGGWSAGPGLRRSTLTVAFLTGLTAGAGAWSLRPAPGQPFTMVVFRSGSGPQQVFSALASADARLVWADPSMTVVVVDVASERSWSFYGHGALLVSGSRLPAGCLDWIRI